MGHHSVIIFILLCSVLCEKFETAQASQSLKQLCLGSSAFQSQSSFLENVRILGLGSASDRKQLADHLKNNPKSPCWSAVAYQLNLFVEENEKWISSDNKTPKAIAQHQSQNAGKLAFLELGLIANQPLAFKLVEQEMHINPSLELIELLERKDPLLCLDILKKHAAHLSPKSSASQKMTSPLLLGRYVSLLKTYSNKWDLDDLKNLNTIYLALSTAEKQVLSNTLVQLFQVRSKDWILDFKQRDPVSQILLFPLLQRMETPDSLREILRLSQTQHVDGRLKALATQSLDTLANKEQVHISKVQKR